MYHDPRDAILRQRAREAMQNGKLPSRPQDRTFGGSGTGAACAVCHEPVLWNMTELELQFDYRDGHEARTESFTLHHRCFGAWIIERDKIAGTPGL